MTVRKAVSPILGLAFLGLFVLYGLYTLNSVLLFQKALSYEEQGRERAAALAHAFVIAKYPISPMSSVSRVYLSQGEFGERLIDEPTLPADYPAVIRNLPGVSVSPFRVDQFAWLSLLCCSFLALYYLDPFGTRRRRMSWGKCVRILVFVSFSTVIWLGWNLSVSGVGLFPSLNEFLKEIGALEPKTIATANAALAGASAFLLMYVGLSVFSGRPVALKKRTSDEETQTDRPTRKIVAICIYLSFLLFSAFIAWRTLDNPSSQPAIAGSQNHQEVSTHSEPVEQLPPRNSETTRQRTERFCELFCHHCAVCNRIDPSFEDRDCRADTPSCMQGCLRQYEGSQRRVPGHLDFLATDPDCDAFDDRF